jgi:hypothetical protein
MKNLFAFSLFSRISKILRFFFISLIIHHLLYVQSATTTRDTTNYLNDDVPGSAALKAKIKSEFDWRAYLEIYQDIANHFSTRDEAIFHYLKFGRKEGRRFPKVFPSQPGLGVAHKKLINFLKIMEERKVPIDERTFIIYYVDNLDHKNSLEVAVNNVRIFNSSIVSDSLQGRRERRNEREREQHKRDRDEFSQESVGYLKEERNGGNISTNFYWFSIIGGIDNVLRPYLPLHLWNVAEVEWALSPSDVFMHFRTLGLFKHTLETKFGSVLFTNNVVRGPFRHIHRGEWVKEFRTLLLEPDNNIGLLGPTLNCENSPHIQTHFFMIRTALIPPILAEYTTFRKFDDSLSLQRRYEIGLTEVVQRNGYNISSLMYHKRLAKPTFDGYCMPKPTDAFTTSLDPTRWCDVTADEVIFFRWGGDMLRSGFLCERMKTYMMQLLMEIKQQVAEEEESINATEIDGGIQLFLPETLKGGELLHLFKEYDQEMWAEASRQKNKAVINPKQLNDKVCFLVRTAQMHDVLPQRTLVETVVEEGIEGIVRCRCCCLLVLLYFLFFLLLNSYLLFIFNPSFVKTNRF